MYLRNSCSEILEKIHPDVAGPFCTNSIGSKYYNVSLVDELFRYTEVTFVYNKTEIEEGYVTNMEKQIVKLVKIFKSDNGGLGGILEET